MDITSKLILKMSRLFSKSCCDSVTTFVPFLFAKTIETAFSGSFPFSTRTETSDHFFRTIYNLGNILHAETIDPPRWPMAICATSLMVPMRPPDLHIINVFIAPVFTRRRQSIIQLE